MSPTRRSLGTGLAVAIALIVAATVPACGADSATPPTTTSGPSGSTPGTGPGSDSGPASGSGGAWAALLPPPDGRALPPNDLAAIADVYDPALVTLGVRMTRAALVDTSDGGYEVSDSGTHLALYVAPIEGTFSAERYADTIAPLSNLITPDVFARWPGVASYDICQEGEATDDDDDGGDAEPPTVSQINVEREALGLLDWSNATLEELIRTAARNRTVRLLMSREVRATEAVRAILPNATPPATNSADGTSDSTPGPTGAAGPP